MRARAKRFTVSLRRSSPSTPRRSSARTRTSCTPPPASSSPPLRSSPWRAPPRLPRLLTPRSRGTPRGACASRTCRTNEAKEEEDGGTDGRISVRVVNEDAADDDRASERRARRRGDAARPRRRDGGNDAMGRRRTLGRCSWRTSSRSAASRGTALRSLPRSPSTWPGYPTDGSRAGRRLDDRTAPELKRGRSRDALERGRRPRRDARDAKCGRADAREVVRNRRRRRTTSGKSQYQTGDATTGKCSAIIY